MQDHHDALCSVGKLGIGMFEKESAIFGSLPRSRVSSEIDFNRVTVHGLFRWRLSRLVMSSTRTDV